MSIDSFAKSFVWSSQNIILPAVLAIPVVVEVASAVIQAVRKPEMVTRKMSEAKQFVIDSFTQRENENSEEFRKRLIKNVLITIAGASLMAGACACPFFLLPLAFAIPSAFIAMYAVGLVFKHANPEKLSELKADLVGAFTQKVGETEDAAKWRILKNVGKAVLCLGAAAAFGVFVFHAVSVVTATIALMKLSPWNVLNALPGQTPVVVFLEYALVGVIHLALAVRAGLKGDYVGMAYHGINGLLSFVFPLQDLLAHGAAGMRLHHSFTGLFLQLFPLRPVQFFGAVVTTDSMLYWASSERGHMIDPKYPWWPPRFDSFDFMNIFVQNVAAFFNMLAFASMFKLLMDELFAEKEDARAKEMTMLQII